MRPEGGCQLRAVMNCCLNICIFCVQSFESANSCLSASVERVFLLLGFVRCHWNRTVQGQLREKHLRAIEATQVLCPNW